jgi:phosphonate transport system ATP-binding protein
VVSMHQLALAREHFSRIVGLKEGRVLFDRGADALVEEEMGELYELEPGV